MKLNLFIIKDELKEFDFQGSQNDVEGVFNISDVHFCTRTMENIQTGIVYVIEGKLLPDRKDIYSLPSVICIGRPSQDWISSSANILYTTQKVDPQCVYDKVSEVFKKYRKIEDELSKLFYENESLSCLDEFLPKYLSNPFNIINSAHEPIYQYFPKLDHKRLSSVKDVFNYNFYYPTESRVVSNAEVYMRNTDQEYRDILKSTNPSLYRMLATGINMLFQNIYVDNSRVGHIEIIELVNTIKISDYLIIFAIAQKLRYWFKINTKIVSTEDDIGALVHSLIKDKNILYGRMSYTLEKTGWNEKDRYIMLLINSEGSYMSIPKMDVLIEALSALFPKIGHTTYEDYLVLLCNLSQAKKIRADVVELIKKLNIPSVKMTLSIEFSPIQNTRFAFSQSNVITKIGLIKYPRNKTYLAEDLFLEYLLYKCKRNQKIELLCPEPLRRLMIYDEVKGTDFVSLLRIYLECERSITKTSKAAFLHRNTTMYKINKIQEIMETDFEDPDERLVLQLILLEYYKNVPDVSNMSLKIILGQ